MNDSLSVESRWGERLAVRVAHLLPKWHAVSLILLGLLVAGLEAAGIALLVPLLALVGIDAGAPGPERVAEIAAAVLQRFGIPPTLGWVLAVYVALVGVQALVARAEAVAAVRVRETAAFRLRSRLYTAIARMRWADFSSRHTSHYVHALTTQLDRVYTGISQLLLLVSQSLIVLVYVAIAFVLAPALSIIAMAGGALVTTLSRRQLRQIRSAGAGLTDTTAALHSTVVEHLANMKVARAFGTAERHIAHFDDVNRELARSWSVSGVAFASGRAIFAFGSAAILALTVFLGVSIFGLSSAGILLLLYVFGRLVPRLGALQQIFHHLVHALPAARATMEEIDRCEAAAELSRSQRAESLVLERGIRFESVSFTYDGRSPVLEGINFEVPADGITAIVGPSGAGKTTIADLLLGLRRPGAGTIVVDGRPLDDAALPCWRDIVAYVPQESVLFNESVRDNLLWAVADADDAELRAAIQDAGAQFVFDLPRGMDAVVGERGSALSGGERQRLALARALLRRPKVLVLDEPTSSLDAVTEAEVFASLAKLRGEITVVLISHRAAALGIADRVYALDAGRIVPVERVTLGAS